MEVPVYVELNGLTTCSVCERKVIDHPLHPDFGFLFVLCKGIFVKVIKTNKPKPEPERESEKSRQRDDKRYDPRTIRLPREQRPVPARKQRRL